MKPSEPHPTRTGLLVLALVLSWAALAGAQSGTATFTLADQEFTSDPAGVSWDQDRIDLFARGNPDGLWHIAWDRASGWSQSENLGGGLIGGPGVCSWGPGRLDVFVRGANSALYHKAFDGAWHNWVQLGPAEAITSDPAAAAWSQDRIDVFARGNPDGLWHLAWDRATGWSQPENLGGGLIGAPAVCSLGPNRLDVFVRGETSALWRKTFDGAWRDWEKLSADGALTSDPSAVAYEGDRIVVVAKGNPDGLWRMWYAGGAWGGPQNEGSSLLSGPTLANARDLFAHEAGNPGKLSQISWTGSQWTPWAPVPPTVAPEGQTQPGIITEVNTSQTFDITLTSYEELMRQLREEEQNVALRIISTAGLNEVFQLRELTYFMIDRFNAANPGRVRDREAWRQALIEGDANAVAFTVPLLVELAKYILDRDPATWSNDERAYVAFLQKLAQQQRYLAATRAKGLFVEWTGKEAEKYGGNLLTLAGTGLHPPAEYLALAEYGYFVDTQYADNFAKIMTAVGGTAGAGGVGLGLAVSGLGQAIGVAFVTKFAGSATLAALGGKTFASVGATVAGTGPAVIVTMMITVGVIKAIEIAEYEAYVARMDAALASSRNPTSTEDLRQLLSRDEGLTALPMWLLCHAATGPVAATSYSSLFTEEPSPWAPMPGAARDLGVGANGALWHIGNDAREGGYGIYRWDGSNWANVPGAAEVIAVDPQGNAWVANSQKQIFRFENGQWAPVPGLAQEIAIGANGQVWVIGTGAEPGGYGIYRWEGNNWAKFPGAGVRLAVDPQGNPWVVAQDGHIHRHDGNQWHMLSGAATDIGVGTDGKVWVVGTNPVGDGFGVHTWNGQDGWIGVPGSLKGIAAGAGKPYGIGPNQEILRMP